MDPRKPKSLFYYFLQDAKYLRKKLEFGNLSNRDVIFLASLPGFLPTRLLFISFRNYFRQLDLYLKLLFFSLILGWLITLLLAGYWWSTDPFKSNYASNISVTCFGFFIAIFVIDLTLKKREKQRYKSLRSVIELNISDFKTDTLISLATLIPNGTQLFMDYLKLNKQIWGNEYAQRRHLFFVGHQKFINWENLVLHIEILEKVLTNVNNLIFCVDKMELPEQLAKLLNIRSNINTIVTKLVMFKIRNNANDQYITEHLLPRISDLLVKSATIVGELHLNSSD